MKERRRDFYIASITEPKQEEKKETAQVQSPPSKPIPNQTNLSRLFGRQKYRRHTAGRIVRECGEAVRRLSETAEIDARRNQEAKCQLCVKHRTIQANP